MKFISYHGNECNMVGGIETLFRSLHKVAHELGYECHEIVSIKNDCEPTNIKKKYKTNVRKIPKINIPFLGVFIKSLFVAYSFLRCNVKQGDVFICVDPRVLTFIPVFLSRKLTVILVQGNRFDVLYGRVSKQIITKKNGQIDYFCVYTDYDKKELMRLFPFIKDKIKVIPRGCKLTMSSYCSKCTNELVVISRISKEKNINLIIDMVDRYILGDYTLKIYGSGDKKSIGNLEKKIAEKNNSRINFYGPVYDLYPALRNGPIFLMASQYEGFGQTLIEARSQGCPIIAFDTFDALKFIVNDGYNGFLVKAFEEQEFTKKINMLLNNKELYKNLSRNALKKSIETDNEYVENLWKQLLLTEN